MAACVRITGGPCWNPFYGAAQLPYFKLSGYTEEPGRVHFWPPRWWYGGFYSRNHTLRTTKLGNNKKTKSKSKILWLSTWLLKLWARKASTDHTWNLTQRQSLSPHLWPTESESALEAPSQVGAGEGTHPEPAHGAVLLKVAPGGSSLASASKTLELRRRGRETAPAHQGFHSQAF